MALPPLHKNSGRLTFDWSLWRLFFTLSIAEDPSKPLHFRNWSIQEDQGTRQRDMFFEIARVTHEFDDGSRQKVWNFIAGPICFWFALMA